MVLAVSTDSAETLKKFRASLQSTDVFISDEDGKLTKLFDVKMPVVTVASRTTFVIGPGRKIIDVQSGGDAINPDPTLNACPLHGHAQSTDAGSPRSP